MPADPTAAQIVVIGTGAGVPEESVALLRDAGVLVVIADDPSKITTMALAPVESLIPADAMLRAAIAAIVKEDIGTCGVSADFVRRLAASLPKEAA